MFTYCGYKQTSKGMIKHGHDQRNNEQVVAATAGLNNWKTWAGREHGEDDFEILDVVRGFKRSLHKRFVSKIPPPGTICLVCYEVASKNKEWHRTSCLHFVCLDCLRAYASSQVRDPEHHGALSCPICPMKLRESDAIRALENDPETIRNWDIKIRDQLLRALPSYRHCPACNNTNGNANTNADHQTQLLTGGGFVTPECLTPIHREREQQAEWLLGLSHVTNRMLLGVYFLCLFFYVNVATTSVYVIFVNVILALSWILPRLGFVCNALLARAARKALFQPIVVECPCCDQSFILNAEAELSPNSNNSVLADDATVKWINSHTRPCPSCSVPISKIGGCNHMQCSHCHARFCWACMRLRTRCGVFNCNNGAPFGNSVRQQGEIGDGGVMDQITRLERRGMRFSPRDVASLMFLSGAVFWSESHPVQVMAELLVTSFSVVFSSGFAVACMTSICTFLLFRPFLSGLERRFANARIRLNSSRREDFRREEAMLEDVIARSLREQ
jgi:hypothetical protein